MVIHSYTTNGKRSYQEDSFNIIQNIKPTNTDITSIKKHNIDFISVFDGHGGPDISNTLQYSMFPYFLNQNLSIDNTPKPTSKFSKYIIDVFSQIQTDLNAKHNSSTAQGSTVCLCIIYKYNNKLFISSAWCGDSRACACNHSSIAIPLTLDHKPNYFKERKRIEALGGFISLNKHDVPRVNNVLAVSRSMGDFDQKQFIDHTPDITHYICDFKFIVIATDGLWDVMDNQMVVDFVLELLDNSPSLCSSSKNKKSNSNIAFLLSEKAIELGSSDNITIIVYFVDI